MRLTKAVLNCVCQHVGNEYIVGMSITIDEIIEGGFGV